ncbi:unnamed protein product [Notodromas monacha]|uniref:Uncharacterized protein n=1 Tax=Notodromas monacha TaxID=399045 RepID=A0A7R9GD87_9CRUS|nr:unnamed protein product [Notodromas monacha]CAG0916710.1 unnamed protein product [Notodromas monacha]
MRPVPARGFFLFIPPGSVEGRLTCQKISRHSYPLRGLPFINRASDSKVLTPPVCKGRFDRKASSPQRPAFWDCKASSGRASSSFTVKDILANQGPHAAKPRKTHSALHKSRLGAGENPTGERIPRPENAVDPHFGYDDFHMPYDPSQSNNPYLAGSMHDHYPSGPSHPGVEEQANMTRWGLTTPTTHFESAVSAPGVLCDSVGCHRRSPHPGRSSISYPERYSGPSFVFPAVLPLSTVEASRVACRSSRGNYLLGTAQVCLRASRSLRAPVTEAVGFLSGFPSGMPPAQVSPDTTCHQPLHGLVDAYQQASPYAEKDSEDCDRHQPPYPVCHMQGFLRPDIKPNIADSTQPSAKSPESVIKIKSELSSSGSGPDTNLGPGEPTKKRKRRVLFSKDQVEPLS